MGWESVRRINQEPRRVNVDFPTWMVAALDREAGRLGVSRQALIKVWIAEKDYPPRRLAQNCFTDFTGGGSAGVAAGLSIAGAPDAIIWP